MPLQSGLARLQTSVRTSYSGFLFLALLVGAGAGVGAVIFRWLIKTFTEIFTGYPEFSSVGPASNPHVPLLGIYFVVLVPVLAGLLYGPMVHFFAREARGHGVPEVMFAVARRGGRIGPQVAVVKALASALCIGGGGSVGREGPIVQIGSALGSTLGGVVRVNESRRRVLVACGAAGGIAATFNAPLAGAFFAMELILRDFGGQSFAMIVIASVTASVIGRAALGNQPFLPLPAFSVDHVSEYLLFALLGLVAGVVGVVFTRVLYFIEDACDWAWRGPEWLRPAVGGVLLGLLLLVLPEMYGVGYPILGSAVAGSFTIAFLVVLLAAKIFATSLTIGIGGSGGVFAPSLFIGAMLGSAYGQAAHALIPGIAGAAGAYGLIGMGAVFAGAARAPITAVVIIFELTNEYSVILPLMTAIVLAGGVSHLLSRDTIYTLKLRRRGVDIDQSEAGRELSSTTVGEVMGPVGETLDSETDLIDAVSTLTRSNYGQVPLVDATGAYLGVITARTLAETLADGQHDGAKAATVLESPSSVRVGDFIQDVLDALESGAASAVPVLDHDGRALVGWLTPQLALLALRRPATPVAG